MDLDTQCKQRLEWSSMYNRGQQLLFLRQQVNMLVSAVICRLCLLVTVATLIRNNEELDSSR